jgi:hypothetical protein
LEPQSSEFEQHVAEGKAIIEKISRLKSDMARDKPLEYVVLSWANTRDCLSEIILLKTYSK